MSVSWTNYDKVVIFFICIILSASSASGLTPEEEENYIIGAVYFDAECVLNSSCVGQELEYLVEYYGADWCDPCESVEEETILGFDGLIVQHHPSPADISFSSDSKIRFEQLYGLSGLPSFVVNGKGLLSGETQANTLDESIANAPHNPLNGFEFISTANGSLFWNSPDGFEVKIWFLETAEHEFRNYTHQNLVSEEERVNSTIGYHNLANYSNLSHGNGMVVILETREPVKLISIYEVPEQRDYIEPLSPKMVTFVTIGLILILVPPIVTQIRYLQGYSPEFEEE